MADSNIIPLHRGIVDQPRDYAVPFTFVPSANQPLSFGERMVLFFRLNGEALTFWFAMVSIGLLVAIVVGAYAGMVL